jgi:hypothetical protein
LRGERKKEGGVAPGATGTPTRRKGGGEVKEEVDDGHQQRYVRGVSCAQTPTVFFFFILPPTFHIIIISVLFYLAPFFLCAGKRQ